MALNLTPIDDDEFIEIDYADGSFEYQLPFKINIENTLNKLDNVIFSNNDEIKLENINIKSNGLISGCGFGTYDEALYDLMDVLSRIRREIA